MQIKQKQQNDKLIIETRHHYTQRLSDSKIASIEGYKPQNRWLSSSLPTIVSIVLYVLFYVYSVSLYADTTNNLPT